MCDPTFIAFAVLSTASTLYGTAQARANADAQVKYQQNIYEANKQIATNAALANYASLQRRRIQEHEAASQAINQVVVESKKAQGTARVAAGESGASGLSVDALLADFHRQELNYQSGVIRQQGFSDLQLQDEAEAVRNQTQGRILSALPQPVAKPDFFGAALRIGTDLIGGYTDATTYDKNTGQRVWRSTGNSVFGD